MQLWIERWEGDWTSPDAFKFKPVPFGKYAFVKQLSMVVHTNASLLDYCVFVFEYDRSVYGIPAPMYRSGWMFPPFYYTATAVTPFLLPEMAVIKVITVSSMNVISFNFTIQAFIYNKNEDFTEEHISQDDLPEDNYDAKEQG